MQFCFCNSIIAFALAIFLGSYWQIIYDNEIDLEKLLLSLNGEFPACHLAWFLLKVSVLNCCLT